MEKLKMHSPNLTDGNIARIRELFPGCVTEAHDENGTLKLAVDFDQLKQELSDSIVEGPQERYHLNWPGKREALLTANAPIAKTLRPCLEESVDFDTTKNLFIEGDNLDALKLLQETYLGKVKMIYIDPPYNRKKGNNLIYRDDFVGNTYDYLIKSNQLDEDSQRLVSNTEANGRFHSDWLSMMYQRLKLSKNILSDNGVVFIAIDDNETVNIRRLCDEIFGEENFVGTIIWKNVTDNNPTNIAVEHESIHVYAKSKLSLESVWKSQLSDIKDVLVKIGEKLIAKHKNLDELQDAYLKWFKENKSQLSTLDRYKYIDFDGIYTGSQSVHNPGKEGYRYDIIHPDTKLPCKEPLMGYRFPKETMAKLLSEEKILFGDDHNKIVELKVYAKDYEDKLSSVFELDGRTGPYDLKELFPEAKKVFSNPKPVALLERLLSFSTADTDTCLDLFAGSSTFAHALMNLNIADGGHRVFISIQYPEEITSSNKESIEAFDFCKQKNIKPNIAEISKERIRRAGKKIKDEKEQTVSGQGVLLYAPTTIDTGFRVLKIDSSNMAEVYYTPDAVNQVDLFNAVDNIKPDRKPEDLLFQVLLDAGVDLSLTIRKETIQGKTVFFVDENALVACFDTDVNEELVRELAQFRSYDLPIRKIVFRDNGFASDAVKINVEQIFRQLSPGTEVKSI
jgi:adenine-specific DNA-methyltransferase